MASSPLCYVPGHGPFDNFANANVVIFRHDHPIHHECGPGDCDKSGSGHCEKSGFNGYDKSVSRGYDTSSLSGFAGHQTSICGFDAGVASNPSNDFTGFATYGGEESEFSTLRPAEAASRASSIRERVIEAQLRLSSAAQLVERIPSPKLYRYPRRVHPHNLLHPSKTSHPKHTETWHRHPNHADFLIAGLWKAAPRLIPILRYGADDSTHLSGRTDAVGKFLNS
ncbi:hypothetical protein BU16DRAFT_557427 [Lophium mytilinum]|uniref:Uncharacterized protein n=1 Tax=Lophium mytilinum TaxID=390894 RepID=A0A6A6R463_9PEZI|nr:hypothetical protein BU16DRAFT_557427 [Lophium mytilinum]